MGTRVWGQYKLAISLLENFNVYGNYYLFMEDGLIFEYQKWLFTFSIKTCNKKFIFKF